MQQRLIRHRVGAGMLALAGAVAPVAAQGARSTIMEDPVAPVASVASIRPADRAGVGATTGAGVGSGSGSGSHAPRSIIVLESYVGQRPADAEAIMEPLLDELDARGFVARPASVLERVGGRAPRPGTLDQSRTAAEITQPADAGYVAYTRGRFAEAEAVLTLAIRQIHRNPALLVLDTNNLDATFKILVALALSQAKRGDTGGSVATMIELIRTFRSQPITRSAYGPDAEQFYRAVWKQVQAMGRGQLAITSDNEQAVVFVNGQIRGLGKALLADLVPGVYRVFVQVPGTTGRQYEVEVYANELAELHIEWELDSSLWMTDRWLGLVFATEAERAKERGFAGKLARRWGQIIATVGIVQQNDGSCVMASLYDTTGTVVRRALLALDGANEARLRSLATFLAEGTASDGVTVVRDLALDPAGATASSAVPGARWVPGVLVGAGTATVVAGGVLYAIDQDPSRPRDTVTSTGGAGIAVGAVGVVAVGMGLWLWRSASRSGSRSINRPGIRPGIRSIDRFGNGSATTSGGIRTVLASVPVLAIGEHSGFIGWGGEL
jgi:hypothetical protein